MTAFLMRLFVKNYGDPNDLKAREKSGRVAGAVGIATNLLLFAIKLITGLLSGSVAILADAVNNLTDSGSSIIMLVGFKLAGKPADDKHPFGHARIEYLAGVIVSFIVLFLGLQLALTSFQKIFEPEQAQYSLPTLLTLAVSILIKLWQCLFYRSVGRTIQSEAIFATSSDSRNDVVATAVVLLGAGITVLTGWNLDGVMGMAVAVFIIISGVKLILDTGNPLLGTAPDKELVEQIYHKILAYNGVLGIHDLTVHNYGVGKCFASVHCEVSAERDILVSHDLIDNIERDFQHELGIQLVIHLDPVVTGDERTDALHAEVRDCVHAVYPQVSIHDFRVVWGITHTNVVFDVAAPYSLPDSDEEIRRRIAEVIHGLNETCHAVVTVDRESRLEEREH